MNIFILRHGIAVEPGTPGSGRDSERPLTPKGKRKLRKIAKAMAALEIHFDVILSSPYVRARQTAKRVARQLGLEKRLECTELLTPGGSARELLDVLKREYPNVENVLLVGHEPYLSELIAWLLSGSAQGVAITLKKAGLCKLTAESLHHGRCAKLEWLLTPEQLSCLG